jgi:hypothetical protein
VDDDDLPPLTLREVSSLGVVAEDSTGAHFYPWAELGAAGLVLVGQDSSPTSTSACSCLDMADAVIGKNY